MSANSQHIIPMLSYENGIAAMEWLSKAFGFSEKEKMLDDNGNLAHGELAWGDSIIILATPTRDYQCPKHHREICEDAAKWSEVPYIINGVLIFVDDIEKHYQRVKEFGVTFLSDIETGGPAARYRAEDLEGQRWMFMQKD
ncbi:MAG: VOC family protein [Chryseolinea sp.]